MTFFAFFACSLPLHASRRVPVQLPLSPVHRGARSIEESVWGLWKSTLACGRGAGVRGESGLADSEVGVLLAQQHHCHWRFSSPLPRASPQNPGQRRFLSSYHFISSLQKGKKKNPILSGSGASFVLTSALQNSHKCSSIRLMPSLWVILCLMLVRGKLPEQI